MITLEFMRQFVETDITNHMERFASPFYFGDGVAATDTKILVYAKGATLIHGVSRLHNPPDVDCVLKKAADFIFEPIEFNIDKPFEEKCDYCGGSGKTNKINCPSCDGIGEVDFGYYQGHWYDDVECKHCDGDGVVTSKDEIDCPDCNGTGGGYSYVPIGEFYYQVKYLKKIPSDCTLAVGISGILYFKNDEIVGAIMPFFDAKRLK